MSSINGVTLGKNTSVIINCESLCHLFDQKRLSEQLVGFYYQQEKNGNNLYGRGSMSFIRENSELEKLWIEINKKPVNDISIVINGYNGSGSMYQNILQDVEFLNVDFGSYKADAPVIQTINFKFYNMIKVL